jgi:hypothetical protein
VIQAAESTWFPRYIPTSWTGQKLHRIPRIAPPLAGEDGDDGCCGSGGRRRAWRGASNSLLPCPILVSDSDGSSPNPPSPWRQKAASMEVADGHQHLICASQPAYPSGWKITPSNDEFSYWLGSHRIAVRIAIDVGSLALP